MRKYKFRFKKVYRLLRSNMDILLKKLVGVTSKCSEWS